MNSTRQHTTVNSSNYIGKPKVGKIYRLLVVYYMKIQRLCRPFEVRHTRDCHVNIIARDVTVPPDWSMQCSCRLRAVSHHVDSPVRLDRLFRCKIRKIASWCSKRQKWSSLFSPREVFNSTEFTKDVIERFLMLVDRGRKYWKPSGVF